jgi:arylsulfatase A-like enzyme
VTGFAELTKIALDFLPPPGYVERSRDAVWMIPMFDAALFLIIGALLSLIARWVRLSWHLAAGILVALGTLLPLLLIQWLHPLAAVVVATGVGVQVGRWLSTRVPAARRLVSRSLPWLAGAVGVLTLLTVGWRVVRERWLAHTRPAAQSGAPNVLLLILDTVRAAELSLYGYARPTTPELERFAQRATVFDHAFSAAPWTLPSHASIFTGRWVPELGVRWGHELGPHWPTLAEVLRARGYGTAAFIANQVYAGWESGFSRGFEHFDDYPISLRVAAEATAFGSKIYPPFRKLMAPVLNRLPVLWRLRLPLPRRNPSAEQINGAFLAWLDRTPRAPFFAFLNFMDAHGPYAPPDSFFSHFRSPNVRPANPEVWEDTPKVPLAPTDARRKQDIYDGSIVYLDSQLGHLFRDLERRGLLDNTLVVVTADHGEEFAEHRVVGHGHTLYRLPLNVPLLISFSGHVPEGRRVADAVSLRNLGATVLDLLPAAGSAPLPGRSLARFWTDGAGAPDTIVASTDQDPTAPAWYPNSNGDLNAIAFGGFNYIRNQGDGSEELYDFEGDVLERWNLAGTDSGQRLLPRYRAALAAAVGLGPGSPLAGR